MAAKTKSPSAVAAEPGTRAYVTFLRGDHGRCLVGVAKLAASLRVVGSAYPLVVAVLPHVLEHHRQILTLLGCVVREVEPVYPTSTACYVLNYSKLRIWEFVEYERMVFLDPEMQVLQNIDELFELEKGHLYAVMDCFCDTAWSHTPQHQIGYCQHCPPDDKQMASWLTAELGPPLPPSFNAKVFVLEPGKATAEALLDALRGTPATPFLEQDLLNMFFKDEYKPISLNFLTDTVLSHPENEHMASNAKVVPHTRNFFPIGGEKLPPPPLGSWLATTTVSARQNLPAMATATLAASSGVVVGDAAKNPAICFAVYAVFLAAIATVTLSLRGI